MFVPNHDIYGQPMDKTCTGRCMPEVQELHVVEMTQGEFRFKDFHPLYFTSLLPLHEWSRWVHKYSHCVTAHGYNNYCITQYVDYTYPRRT
jgi:hypothetical protein